MKDIWLDHPTERFVVSPEAWDEFMAMLDKPVEPNPKLQELFAQPKLWD